MLGKHFFDKISCWKRFLESLVKTNLNCNIKLTKQIAKQIDKAQEGCKQMVKPNNY